MRGPCPSCGAEVVLADAILRAELGAEVHQLPVEPAEMPPATGLLLYVGTNGKTGRWVVTPVGTPSADQVQHMLHKPRAHRPHVCDTFPADWLLEEHVDDRVPVLA